MVILNGWTPRECDPRFFRLNEWPCQRQPIIVAKTNAMLESPTITPTKPRKIQNDPHHVNDNGTLLPTIRMDPDEHEAHHASDRQRKHAGSTPYRDPYPNWEKQADSPKSAAAAPASNKRKFEFKHKVNSAVKINSSRQLQCPVYIDVYGNMYTAPDDAAKTATVTYLDVRDEDFDTN